MEEKKDKEIFVGFSSARRDEDMISKLPNALISQILSYIPTKEAVRTSILSNRWRNLWLWIPGLDLDSNDFSDYNAFASFIDRCLDFYREEKSCLHKLKLSIHKDENDQSSITHWTDFVATHKLKHLDVECFVKRKFLEVIPVSFFICETLLYLRLSQVLVGSFEDSSSVSLPRLKTMRLELNVYANETSIESLISSCPVLEDLSVVRREDDNVKVLRVRSQTLTSLNKRYYFRRADNMEVVDILVAEDFDCGQFGVSIDAPRLKYLTFENEISISKTITNSSSLTKVNILGSFYLENSDDQVLKFFTSFSGVKDLKISVNAFAFIKDVVPLLQFGNLSCFELEFPLLYMEMLPRLLTSCPNLRSLILGLMDLFMWKQVRLLPVPLCLLTLLEFVEIKCDFNGDSYVMELARYFAENSVILKKLVLRLGEENSIVLSDILALPRLSSTCQIIVC